MKRIFIYLIKFYQKHISPHTTPCCRFYPSCSQYGVEAIERFGAFRGGCMTVWRILRCNPMNPGGFDPVPDKVKKNNKRYKIIKYKK